MTTSAPTTGTEPRLHVVLAAAVDTDAPYDEGREWSAWTDGSLALEVPVPLRVPVADPPPLRLVPEQSPEPPTEPAAAPLRPAAAAEAPEVSFAAVRTPRGALPSPGPFATALVRAVLEVIAGDRPVRQLAKCASPAVYDELEVLVSPAAHRPWAGTLRRVLLCEPLPGVAEVTAVVSRGARTAALALRLEGVDGRWQLTALQLV